MHVRCWAGPGGPGARTVVLLHGIVSSRYLVPTARELARSRQVYGFRPAGVWPNATNRPAVDDLEMADLVAARMAASGLRSSTVAGHSVGAQVAADLAVHHPHLMRHVVLAGPTVDQGVRSVPFSWVDGSPMP